MCAPIFARELARGVRREGNRSEERNLGNTDKGKAWDGCNAETRARRHQMVIIDE